MAHIDRRGRIICSHCGSSMRLWTIKDNVMQDKRTVVYHCYSCNGRAMFGLSAPATRTNTLEIVRETHQGTPQNEHGVGG